MRSCGRFSMETIGSANEMLGAWNLIRDGGGGAESFYLRLSVHVNQIINT